MNYHRDNPHFQKICALKFHPFLKHRKPRREVQETGWAGQCSCTCPLGSLSTFRLVAGRRGAALPPSPPLPPPPPPSRLRRPPAMLPHFQVPSPQIQSASSPLQGDVPGCCATLEGSHSGHLLARGITGGRRGPWTPRLSGGASVWRPRLARGSEEAG